MSKPKRCPFCDIEFVIEEDRGHKYYTHPHVGCFFDYLPILVNDEDTIRKWNTRKPMERILERLEAQAAFENVWDDDLSCGAYHAYSHAIEIVQEEGV